MEHTEPILTEEEVRAELLDIRRGLTSLLERGAGEAGYANAIEALFKRLEVCEKKLNEEWPK